MLVDNKENVFLIRLVIAARDVGFSYVTIPTIPAKSVADKVIALLIHVVPLHIFLIILSFVSKDIRCAFLRIKFSFEKIYMGCYSSSPEFMRNRFASILLI